MGETTNIFVFLLCVLATADSNTPDCGNDRDEKTRQLIVELNKETSEHLKWRVDALFHNLVESINQQLIMISSNIHYELEMLNHKVDTNHRELVQINKLLTSLSYLQHQNVTTVLPENLSRNETGLTDLNEVSDSPGNLSVSPVPDLNTQFDKKTERSIKTERTKETRSRVVVEEVTGNSGTLEFDGKDTSNLHRKIWVLQHDEKTYISDVRFVMEENKLGENAYLTIWSGSISPLNRHLYNGSHGDWRKERRSAGNLIIVTLTVRNSKATDDPPRFKLRFNATRSQSAYAVFSSEIMTKEGVQLLTYPSQNTRNYLPRSLFYAVIAPQSGTPFKLSLKYLDVPVIMPHCWGYLFRVYFINENPNETQYEMVPGSIVRHCQKPGNVSTLIGHATVAIVRFESFATNTTGLGFVMEVDPSVNED